MNMSETENLEFDSCQTQVGSLLKLGWKILATAGEEGNSRAQTIVNKKSTKNRDSKSNLVFGKGTIRAIDNLCQCPAVFVTRNDDCGYLTSRQ